MPSRIRRWSPNLLPRLPSSDGITDSTAAQNSSEITPIRVTGQSSLVNAFPFGRHALEPADVDRHTGYRRYTTAQIPIAQVIKRFRELDMPLDQIRAMLEAPDLESRNRLIAEHLNRLEDGLSRTQMAVASSRDLL